MHWPWPRAAVGPLKSNRQRRRYSRTGGHGWALRFDGDGQVRSRCGAWVKEQESGISGEPVPFLQGGGALVTQHGMGRWSRWPPRL